jgi:hypothetical protein
LLSIGTAPLVVNTFNSSHWFRAYCHIRKHNYDLQEFS